jgi:hypothetical protein
VGCQNRNLPRRKLFQKLTPPLSQFTLNASKVLDLVAWTDVPSNERELPSVRRVLANLPIGQEHWQRSLGSLLSIEKQPEEMLLVRFVHPTSLASQVGYLLKMVY